VSQGRRKSCLKLADGRTVSFPAVMGILNVTPDSFSDGGLFLDPEKAVEHGLAMESEGAAIIDIGGESTRPVGARSVPPEEELRRLVPVLDRLGKHLHVPFSIDTRKAIVARAALDRGAAIINDVSALSADPEMGPLAAKTRAGPENHMQYARYRSVVTEVVTYLRERVRFAIRNGIRPGRIIVDPGLGFAKTARHNLALLGSLSRICALGYPVLVGASRKSFVRKISGQSAKQTESGNAAVHALAIAQGAAIIRVHDVGAAVAASKMAAACCGQSRHIATSNMSHCSASNA
jgi:dihydropteroate synthase